jgi:geranylgeranyl reductase family protein
VGNFTIYKGLLVQHGTENISLAQEENIISEKFDMIVVGAGTAGCLAAKTVSEAGLKVCLVDRKKKEEIGEKVCGDALGEHHLKNAGLEKPNGGELEKRIEGIKIYSPDLKTVMTIGHEDFVGYVLNRQLFGQWVLKKALDAGAVLMESTLCTDLILERHFVTGIVAKNSRTGENCRLRAEVVADASGYAGVVRRKVPAEMGIQNEIENEDIEACYREIRQLRQETEHPEYCEIYLNQEASPGGYAWVFPKGGAKVNVGVGICMRGKFPNPKGQLYKHVLAEPTFDGSLVLTGGAWYDPTRRPLDNMVGNGVVILGDAACVPNPIHGGGIGPSMLSGYLAGGTIVGALEKGVASREAMWSYNGEYMKAYGTKQAGLEVFRRLLLSVDDEDLNYAMAYEVLTEEDVLKVGMGEDLRLNITEKARRVFRGIKRVGLLNKLRLTVKFMRQVKSHYQRYPETPEGFTKWQAATETLFKEAKAKVSA